MQKGKSSGEDKHWTNLLFIVIVEFSHGPGNYNWKRNTCKKKRKQQIHTYSIYFEYQRHYTNSFIHPNKVLP